MNRRYREYWRRAALPFGVLLATTILAAPAGAGDHPDQSAQTRIEEKLASKDFEGVTVQVANGVAILSGTVDTLRQKNVAERIALDVDGVNSVRNDTRVIWGGRTSEEIAADVERALYDPNFNTVFDWVEAEVDGRSVVLTGWVTMPWKIQTAATRMSRIPGVESVEAKIEVLPVSINDDDIRAQAARSIYRSHTFFDRAGQINPPVHIVVRHGEVILMGEVRNRAEMMQARALVSSASLPFRIVNNLRWRGDGRT